MAYYYAGNRGQSGPLHRNETELRGYRFGRHRNRHARSLSALHRANSYLRVLIQSMADARFRRMVRELEAGGSRLDMRDERWIPDALRGRAQLKSINLVSALAAPVGPT